MTAQALFSFSWSEPRRCFRWVLYAVAFALAVLDGVLLATGVTPAGTFEIQIRSAVSSRVQVFFDTGHGFAESESIYRPVAAGPDAQTLDFPLPPRPVLAVRIDPLEVPGTANIHAVRVRRTQDHAVVREFDLESITAGAEIDRLTSNIEGLEVVTQPNSRDSQLGLPLASPISLRPTILQWTIRLVALDGVMFLGSYALAFAAFFGWPQRRFRWPYPESLAFLVQRWIPDRWAALAFLLPLACAGCYFAAAQQTSYYLEVVLNADRRVVSHFYFDAGAGFTEPLSIRATVEKPGSFETLRCPLPVRTIQALRFDPAEGPVAMRVYSVAIRSEAEDWLGAPPYYSFNLRSLWPVREMKELVHEDNGTIRLLVPDGATDPATSLTLPAPVIMDLNVGYVGVRLLLAAAAWVALWGLAVEISRRVPDNAVRAVRSTFGRAWQARRRLSPTQAIWLIGGASVVLSCYPVIFCGKSFCSPNFSDGTYELYQAFPTVPGGTDATLASGRGADVFTMAWQAAPEAVAASRSLFHDHELPLWNRYADGGTPLLGQGQSMLGDPLHWLVLAAGGRAWAWDLKFLLAKWLFTAGVGLLVLAAVKSVPVALLLSFSAAFLGFFSFRLNHPAFFSECYAPWIALAWLRIGSATDWRRAAGWMGGLILANWMEINSGSLGEAFALVLCLNLYGAASLLMCRLRLESRVRRLLGVVVAGGLLLLLLAPLLVTMADTLKHAVERDQSVDVRQLAPGLLLGLFDDIFYRQITLEETHLAPAMNSLVLLGVLLSLAVLHRLWGNRTFRAALLGAVLPLMVVFRLLPLPLVHWSAPAALVSRADAAFSGASFIPLFILAGFGLKECLEELSRVRWLRGLGIAAVAGGALAGTFLALAWSVGDDGLAALKQGQAPTLSPFFLTYVPVLVAATALLPFVLRRIWLRGPGFLTVSLLAGCLFLIHWRQGLQLGGTLAKYAPVLPGRVDLLSHSPAVDSIVADRAGPFRAVGLGANLTSGYTAIAGLEGVDSRNPFISPYFEDLKEAGLKLPRHWLTDDADEARLAAAKRFYDLLGVRYYVTLPDVGLANVPGLERIAQLDLDVYRNVSAWPRAFFTDRLEPYAGVPEFVRLVADATPEPFAAIETSEYGQNPELTGRFKPGPAARTVVPALRYHVTSNHTAFDVEAPRPGVIVLGEAFERANAATVNGKRARVFRVNHAFEGVAVDRPGLYHVVFGYEPAFLAAALWISAFGWTLFAAGAWGLSRSIARQTAGAPVEKLDRVPGLALEHAPSPGS